MADVSGEVNASMGALTSGAGAEQIADVIAMPGMETVPPERLRALAAQMFELLTITSQKTREGTAVAFASTMSGLLLSRFEEVEAKFTDILEMVRAGADNITVLPRVGQVARYSTTHGVGAGRALLRRSLISGVPGGATQEIQLPQLPDAALLQTESHLSMTVDVQEIPNVWHGDNADGTLFELPETEVMPSFSSLFVKAAVHTKNPEDAKSLETLYEQIDQLSDYQVVEVALLTLAAYRLMQHAPNYGASKVDRAYEHLAEYLAGMTDAGIAAKSDVAHSGDLTHVRAGRRNAMKRLSNVREYVGSAVRLLLVNPEMRILEQRGNQFRFTPTGVMHLTAMARAPYDPETSVTPYMRKNTAPDEVQDQMGEFFSQAREAYQRSLAEKLEAQMGTRLLIIDAHIQGRSSDQIAKLFDISPSDVRVALDDFSRFVAGEDVPHEFQATLSADALTEGLGGVAVTLPAEMLGAGLAGKQDGEATTSFALADALMPASDVNAADVTETEAGGLTGGDLGAAAAEELGDLVAEEAVDAAAVDAGQAGASIDEAGQHDLEGLGLDGLLAVAGSLEYVGVAGADLEAARDEGDPVIAVDTSGLAGTVGSFATEVLDQVVAEPTGLEEGGQAGAEDELTEDAEDLTAAEEDVADPLTAEAADQADEEDLDVSSPAGDLEMAGQAGMAGAQAASTAGNGIPGVGEADTADRPADDGDLGAGGEADAADLTEGAEVQLAEEGVAAEDETGEKEENPAAWDADELPGARDVTAVASLAAPGGAAGGVTVGAKDPGPAREKAVGPPMPKTSFVGLMQAAGSYGFDAAGLAKMSGMPEAHVIAVIAEVVPRVVGALRPHSRRSAVTGMTTVHYAGRSLEAIAIQLVGMTAKEMSDNLHVPQSVIRKVLNGRVEARSSGRYGLEGWGAARQLFRKPEEGSRELSSFVSSTRSLAQLTAFTAANGGLIREHYDEIGRMMRFATPATVRLIEQQSASDYTVGKVEPNWISRADAKDAAHFDQWIARNRSTIGPGQMRWMRRSDLRGIDPRGVVLPHYDSKITAKYLVEWKRVMDMAAKAAAAQTEPGE